MGRMPFRIRASLAVLGLLAAALLIAPLLWPIPPLEDVQPARDLAPADATWLDVGGLELHARVTAPPASAPTDAASGPEGFVLLHGFASTLHSWEALTPFLASEARTLAFDRPAFGLSDRPLAWDGPSPYRPEAQVARTLGAMDEVGMDTAVLVGHSSGALLALRVAQAAPARVEGLVLLGPAVHTPGGPARGMRWLLHTPQLDRLGPLLMRQLAGASTENLARAAYADPDRLRPEALDAAERTTRVEDWDRALWAFTQAQRPPRIGELVSGIGVPTLVLSGSEDEVVPAEDAERLADDLANARLARLEGCGHAVQEECPDAVADALDSWVDEVRITPGG